MARRGPADTWICPMCERALHRSEFAADAYRERTGRGPGRCIDCEREYSRALTALSPSGKYGDADHPAALNMARETCRAHSWGRGYYSKSDKAVVLARDATARIRGRREPTAAERRDAETVMREGAERKRVAEYREQDRAIAARLAERDKPAETIPGNIPASDSAYKTALKQWRREREGPPPVRADYE